MTLPLSKEQIEAIQAQPHLLYALPDSVTALCQQALRAIELEAMFQFEGDDAAHMKPNDPALKDGIVVRRDHFDEMLKRQHSLQSELAATRKALEEERERCAKVCEEEAERRFSRAKVPLPGDETIAPFSQSMVQDMKGLTAKHLASAIRALPSAHR